MYIFREKPSKKKNRGRVTILGEVKKGSLYLSASKNHSVLDKFKKQEGRWRALERLIKGEYLAIVSGVGNCDSSTFLSHAVTLSRLVSIGTLKPVMIKGIRHFQLKDFLDSSIVPKEKKEAYLKQQSNEAPVSGDSIPSVG